MAEFITMQEAENTFGKKGKTNAALTLGIIGTGLAALTGNNNGCGNNGGILGNLFGGNNNCLAERAMQMAQAQGQQADNLAWANRVQSMQDDIDLYTYINGLNLTTNKRIGDESQLLTNQIWSDRVQDLKDKSSMYIDLLTRDNAQNLGTAREFAAFREKDIQEKTDIFERVNKRLVELEKKDAAISASLPLMFELSLMKANKYSDEGTNKVEKELLISDAGIQRQLDRKIDGTLKYAYSDLCAPVPSIAPLYCSPFTQYGLGSYIGAAAANYNAVTNAACPSCTVQ